MAVVDAPLRAAAYIRGDWSDVGIVPEVALDVMLSEMKAGKNWTMESEAVAAGVTNVFVLTNCPVPSPW